MKLIFKEWLKDKKALAILIASMIMVMIHSVMDSYMIIAIRNIFDHPQDHRRIWLVVGILIAAAIILPLKVLAEKYAIQHNLREMSIRWNQKLIDVDFELFTRYSCSKVYSIGEFVWSCSSAMRSLIYGLSRIIGIITTLIGIYILGGNLVLMVFSSYTFFGIMLRIALSKYDKIDKNLNVIRHARNQHTENIVNGFSEIRVFGDQNNQNKIAYDYAHDIFKKTCQRSNVSGWIEIIYRLSDLAGVMIVMIFCLAKINAGVMSAATAVSLILYVFKIIGPIESIINIGDMISQNKYIGKDYEAIMQHTNTLQYGEINLSEFNDTIRIKNLNFSYNDSDTVLRNINMKIRKGQHIGICGLSGNGKSTLAKLMLHLYDPKEGSIKIDGIDIREVTDKSFRNLVGTVQQENQIFPGSIMSNIVFGNNHAIESEIVEACKKAKIYDFIMSKPEKFDTELGPRGITLSGGEQQRIALARLFLKNPEIIILDEATSALDNKSETFIQEAIDSMKDKTVIIIAHRLSTIKNCDKIFVMDNGAIVESGSHEELIQRGGKYTELQK